VDELVRFGSFVADDDWFSWSTVAHFWALEWSHSSGADEGGFIAFMLGTSC